MLVDINLLPQKERDRPAFLIAAIAILLLAVIIWAVFAFLANANENEQAELTAQSTQVAAEQAAIREQLEAKQGMNEEQQLKVTVDWAESYQFDTLPLLKDLVSKLPARGFFDSFSYVGLDQAVLTVQFDTAREAAFYLAQLKTSELLKSATLDSVTQEELEAEAAPAPATGETVVVVEEEDAVVENPRYLATYTLLFVDDRIPAEVVEGEVPAEGTAEQPAAETPPAETPAETPATETPAETTETPATEPAADVEVDVEMNQETPATPEGTEGNGQ
ncbi:fimbrial assembly protein [Planococcus shenhongbingii]|uniref:Fimbrial assembly protein n=1 Tax=Planococcus shenhongbingii TaxID=3058398 RepID=A0ABT8NDB3_9BACL|nr:fimbrial assembly protein [Planococcus sp. N017]MDN7245880.1 fimbrial assembly protein [Planococcus sp. N017]